MTKSSILALLSLVLVLAGAALVAQPAAAQGADVPNVTLQVKDGVTVEENVPVDIELVCETGVNVPLFSCFADIAYNPAQLTVNSITASANFNTYAQGDFQTTAGIIDMLGGVASHSPITSAGPSNVVATINVTPTTSGNVTMTPSADNGQFTELTAYGFDDDLRDNSPVFITLTMNVVEDQAPSIIASTPEEGDTVATSFNQMSFTFSEAVTTVPPVNFGLTCNGQTVLPTGSTSSQTIPNTFLINLATTNIVPGASCEFFVTTEDIVDSAQQTMQDTDGNDDGTFRLTFDVEELPQITSVSPQAGSTNVSTTQTITIVTNKTVGVVGPVSLTCNGAVQFFTPNGTNAPTYTISPVGSFPEKANCVLNLPSSSITDSNGNQLVDNDGTPDGTLRYPFTTGPGPSITGTSPANGATNVALDDDMEVTFAALGFTINPSTPYTFTCNDGNTTQDLTQGLTLSPPSGTTFTLNTSDYLPGANCELNVPSTFIRDGVGNVLEDNDGTVDGAYVVQFQTAGAAVTSSSLDEEPVVIESGEVAPAPVIEEAEAPVIESAD